MTGSALAIGLGAAILLRLVFLLGTRQRAEATWSVADDSTAAALDHLRKQAQLWKVDPETIELCVRDAERLFERIRAGEAEAEDGRLTMVFDGVDLTLDFSFEGEQPAVPASTGKIPEFRRELLDNEEAAAHIGLLHFPAIHRGRPQTGAAPSRAHDHKAALCGVEPTGKSR
jgi:hypothetical protein